MSSRPSAAGRREARGARERNACHGADKLSGARRCQCALTLDHRRHVSTATRAGVHVHRAS